MVTTDDGPRIGPNAVTRLAEALTAAGRDPYSVFAAADLAAYLTDPPEQMVPTRDVTCLYAALRAALGPNAAARGARDAGERTASYLLERRIPKPAQAALRMLSPGLSARLLLMLIARNAWTFAGASQLVIQHGRPSQLSLTASPFAAEAAGAVSVCHFYVGTFERLFQTLVAPTATACETSCRARGAQRCVFQLDW